jgi:hypothetical protein
MVKDGIPHQAGNARGLADARAYQALLLIQNHVR